MANYKRITGMRDVLVEEQVYWRYILEKIEETVDLFGYQRIDTPLIEEAKLFVRGVGEGTDIVEKEMYIFDDRDGGQLALRPEFTAGIMRAFVENGLHTLPTPLRVWTVGPLFRHERPQAGRYRQHTQFDVEVIGEQDAAVDQEVISLALHLFGSLGFSGLRLYINSTGCPECRPQYIEKLVAYFEQFAADLPKDDQLRLQKNPLRLLDTKEPYTQKLLPDAPHIADYLCADCAAHFAKLQGYLEAVNQPYTVDYTIVRGLDYYTKTVFEIKADGLGSQDTICGGGRYDGLIEEVGGNPTPGIGFGSGIERFVIAMQHLGVEPPPVPLPQVAMVYFGEVSKLKALQVIKQLRAANIGVTFTPGDRGFKAQMRSADRSNARYTILIGEDELQAEQASVRNMQSGEQVSVLFTELVTWLEAAL